MTLYHNNIILYPLVLLLNVYKYMYSTDLGYCRRRDFLFISYFYSFSLPQYLQ